MDAATALARLGGLDPRSLLRLTTRRALRRGVRRGRYALPTAEEAQRTAGALHGVVCLRRAAALHGWELKIQRPEPEVAVPCRAAVE